MIMHFERMTSGTQVAEKLRINFIVYICIKGKPILVRGLGGP
jgi:hypothetical protein